MASTTPIFKWAVPQSSDQIKDIWSIVSSAINGIENNMIVAADSKSVADTYDTYPLGMSVLQLTYTGATNGAWPLNSGAVVVTFRRSGGDAASQLWFKNDTAAPELRFRAGNTNGWSDWVVVGNTKLPDAVLTGQVTATPPTGGGTIAIPVTFPSGYFSGAPRVYATINASTKPQESAASADGTSATGCTIYLYRSSATPTSVAWQAIHGVEA